MSEILHTVRNKTDYRDKYSDIDDNLRREITNLPYDGGVVHFGLGSEKTFVEYYQKYNGLRSGVSRLFMMNARLEYLQNLAKNENLDMTITLAQKLSKALFDMSINMQILKRTFGTSGRSADDKTKDFARIFELVEKYKTDATTYYFDKKDELSKLQTDTKKFLAWMKERAAKQGNERFSR